MGSMLKADSDRRELVRERRQARIERKQERRDARERKRSQVATPPPPALSVIQRAGQEQVDAAVDQIANEALARHDQNAAAAGASGHRPQRNAPAMARQRSDAPTPAERRVEPIQPRAPITHESPTPRVAARTIPLGDGERPSRRERDIAAFGERRRQAADQARAEARARIAWAGELACVADALAALGHPGASPWESERKQLERALDTGRIVEVGAAARRSLWAISRDAARSSRRARRDPDLAVAACVAFAIIARLPRTALRSSQRTRPTPPAVGRRAFWR
jgi:hypothetical protein